MFRFAQQDSGGVCNKGKRMQTVVFMGNSRVETHDAGCPEPAPGEVLIRVGASAICGSEMKRYRAPDPLRGNPGHEMVGEVVETRSDTGPRVGDRVAVNIITGCGQCAACRAGAWPRPAGSTQPM